MWFQVHYPPLIGVLPIFRSRYSFAIGHQRVFSLAGWSPRIRTHFHVLSRTQDTAQSLRSVVYGTFTRCGRSFQGVPLEFGVHIAVLQPRREFPVGLGLSAFARRYLRNRGFFLFLQVLRCFSSLGLHGNLGIRTRLTATPSFSQSSTPLCLLVPRHPPHALTSLARLFQPSVLTSDRTRQDSPTPSHDGPGVTIQSLILRLMLRSTTRQILLRSTFH